MARNTDIPGVQNPPSGDVHHITSRYMNATELAARDARQKNYDDMLARQQAYEDRFIKRPLQQDPPRSKGCVFAKSCNLPDGVINHVNPTGFIPVEKLADYGKFSLLGGQERDAAGNIPLKKISGSALPAALGTLVLGGVVAAGTGTTAAAGAGVVAGGVAAGALAGMVALLSSEMESVAASAVTALGHIARRHSELDREKVLPALEAVKKKFPSLEGVIADALDDIDAFT